MRTEQQAVPPGRMGSGVPRRAGMGFVPVDNPGLLHPPQLEYKFFLKYGLSAAQAYQISAFNPPRSRLDPALPSPVTGPPVRRSLLLLRTVPLAMMRATAGTSQTNISLLEPNRLLFTFRL